MGENVVNALDNVSLQIQKGEYVTIVGTSGSGKSTLMNILGCLDLPSTGKYYLDGQDVSLMNDNLLSDIRNNKIGFIFQGFNLIPTLTAYENVELPLIYRHINKQKRKEVVEAALKNVNLYSRRSHLPSEMSGGQQQRVAIARAIASSPDVILADEPCGNLDSRSGSDVMNIFHELNSNGKTIILITHDENTANKAQRLIRISDGKIIS